MAHGYLTVQPNTSLLYILDGRQNDDKGLRWNDPTIGIDWPAVPKVISTRDQQWGLL
jgi:dTDP-4-dehydrorhamnose 3,5-epimerase